MDDKPEGVRAYNGEYMSQYSWGEIQNVLLKDREKSGDKIINDKRSHLPMYAYAEDIFAPSSDSCYNKSI